MRQRFKESKIRAILRNYFKKVDELAISKATEGISTNVYKISVK